MDPKDPGVKLEGCRVDVSLGVQMHPELTFKQFAAEYNDEARPQFRADVDKARAIYLHKLEMKKDDMSLECNADVLWVTAYGCSLKVDGVWEGVEPRVGLGTGFVTTSVTSDTSVVTIL